MTAPARQLLAYKFGPESSYEGQLVGALERIESGGALRIVDALFVGRGPDTGEVTAVSLSGGSAGMIGRLLSFRLDAGERQAATQRALEGPTGEIVRTLGDQLQPGVAIAAVLIEHAWAQALDEAVRRMGGAEAVSESTDAAQIAQAAALLREVAAQP
jgi:hypothetical protein